MTSIIRLQDVLPKSVLSYYRGKGLNGNRQYPPFGDWRIKNNSQVAKVIQELEPRSGRCFYETKEKYMVWIPGEIVLTSSNNGGTDNTSLKSPLVTENSVTLAVDSILNVDRKLLTDDEVQIQSSLIRVKRRYPVEISVPRPSTGRGTGGGDAKNMGVIHTTLLMVTAHCQLHIQIPGKEAVKVPSTDEILKYGDGCSSKLQHTTSVDSGYESPGSPDIGGGEGRNSLELGDRQMTSEVIKETPADDSTVQMITSHAIQVADETNGTSFPVAMSHGSGIVDVVKDGIENQPVEADGAKLKHSSSVKSGYENAVSLGLGISDSANLPGQKKEPGDSKLQTLSHTIQVAKEFEAKTTDVMSSCSVMEDSPDKSGVFENRSVETEADKGENRVMSTEGVPEPKKPDEIIDKEFVRVSGAEGDSRAVGWLGVGELENAATIRGVQKHIREEFHKVDMVDQLARGELAEGVIGRSVPVESGEKDVDATVNDEKLKKEDSLDEGIEEFKEPCENDNYFDKHDCCDILLPYKEDSASTAVVEFCQKFRQNHKQLKIRTFDDYHYLGLEDDHIYEAAWRASKILTYVTREEKVAFREDLLAGHCRSLGNKKDYRIIFACVKKGCKSFLKKNSLDRFSATLMEQSQVPLSLTAKNISNIIEKREMTGKRAHEHLLEMEKPLQPSSPLPNNQRLPSSVNRSPLDVKIEDFNQSETNSIASTKVFILCDTDDRDNADELADRVTRGASGKTIRVSTPDDFHVHGLHKNQVGIEKSVKVLIYASQRYANDQSMIRKLNLAKAITEKERNSMIVVPKGMSRADYNGYKPKLHLASQLQTFYEDKDTDMTPLIAWLAEDGP